MLVDTSAWVDFFNGHESAASASLAALLDGPDDAVTCGVVVAEVFQGLRDPRTRRQIEVLMRCLPFLESSGMDIHLRAAEMFRLLRSRGVTVRSTIDCLIVALAEEGSCSVLARDRDIAAILGSGIVRVAPWGRGA